MNKTLFSYFLIFLIFSFGLWLFNKNQHLEKQIEVLKEQKIPVNLVQEMGQLQKFVNKLYFSSKSKNKALTEFYIHELEEVMENIQKGDIVKNRQKISTLIESFGLKSLETYEKNIFKDDFENLDVHYQALTLQCNNCHAVSGYGFIQIQKPTQVFMDNQIFYPEE